MIYRLAILDTVEDVQELRVLEWHGVPGRAFAVGDMIVELETHKVVIEVRAGQAAILRQVLIEDGSWGKVGATIGLLSDTDDERLPDITEGLGECLVTLEVA